MSHTDDSLPYVKSGGRPGQPTDGLSGCRVEMSLLGDIVERDDDVAQDAASPAPLPNVNGFPELYKPTKVSSWKQRLRDKNAKHRANANANAKPGVSKADSEAGSKASEAEAIHNENIKVLQSMSEADILRERQELMESFDPKLLQSLLKNINQSTKDQSAPLFAEIEGAPGTWVGGTGSIGDLPPLDEDKVNKALGVEKRRTAADADGRNRDSDRDSTKTAPLYPETSTLDDDDVAPLDFQMAQSIDHMSNEELMSDVHFVTHNNPDEEEVTGLQNLNLDDADFNEKLYQKFFPDLPKDVEKLKWMESLDDSEKPQVVGDVSQCRFDFRGNLVPPTREITSTTHSALHHHSDDPQLAGYTIPELQRLSRSNFSGQRSIALQTLGRILYKMGKQSYYQLVPEVDLATYQEDGSTKDVLNKIYAMFWDLCKDCRILECLQDAADEKKTRHLSVRNYALDALWLWKSGGGDFRDKKTTDV